MLVFLRQTDINYFQGDQSQLGHHQGPRVQLPDGLQQETTSSWTLTYYTYIFYAYIFKTNRFILISRRSMSTRSPPGTARATSWWSTAGFYFIINPHILYMFYAWYYKTNQYKPVSWRSKSTRLPPGTSRAMAWLIGHAVSFEKLSVGHTLSTLFEALFEDAISIYENLMTDYGWENL